MLVARATYFAFGAPPGPLRLGRERARHPRRRSRDVADVAPRAAARAQRGARRLQRIAARARGAQSRARRREAGRDRVGTPKTCIRRALAAMRRAPTRAKARSISRISPTGSRRSSQSLPRRRSRRSSDFSAAGEMARHSKGDNATVERQLADLDDLPADRVARSKPLADGSRARTLPRRREGRSAHGRRIALRPRSVRCSRRTDAFSTSRSSRIRIATPRRQSRARSSRSTAKTSSSFALR